MKPKLLLGLALGLSGGLLGCSTGPKACTQLLDYSAGGESPVTQEVIIQGLGKGFSIRAAADSWPALVQKVKPTFAWGGCDMMWIESDKHGQPKFILDEAYIYQPTNQPRQWVLLNLERNVPYEDLRQEIPKFFYSHLNLHGVAPHYTAMPASDDRGGKGNYSVTIGAHRQFGTVYEIGWQREMSVGSGHADYGRRIYVLKDRGNNWHFLGEGPEEGGGRGGGCTVESRVIWENSKTNNLPFQIRFHREETTSPYNISAEATNPPPDVTVCYDTALVSVLPTRYQAVGKNPYLLAERNDTLETIAERLGYWQPGWEVYGADMNPDVKREADLKKRVLAMWRAELARLNPQLTKTGNLKAGTRVEIPTNEEVVKLVASHELKKF